MADAQRVEIGFEGGQVVSVRLGEDDAQGPAQAAREGRLARPPHRGRGRRPLPRQGRLPPRRLGRAPGRLRARRVMRARAAARRRGGLATLAAALWWRKNPSACPYGQRFWVEAPHPIITRDRLRAGARAREPGERLLEIGPGTGYYTLDIAEWVGARAARSRSSTSSRRCSTTRCAGPRAGLGERAPAQGDATALPYEDDSVRRASS